MLLHMLADLLCPLNQALNVGANLVLAGPREVLFGNVGSRQAKYLLVFVARLAERVTWALRPRLLSLWARPSSSPGHVALARGLLL